MWVDPDSGLSFEQILEKFWQELPPNVQAEYRPRHGHHGTNMGADVPRGPRALSGVVYGGPGRP